jgi:hypothetical protein
VALLIDQALRAALSIVATSDIHHEQHSLITHEAANAPYWEEVDSGMFTIMLALDLYFLSGCSNPVRI